jgi:hypothetical protein
MHKTFTIDNTKTNIEHKYDYNPIEASLMEDRSNFQKASTSGFWNSQNPGNINI